jgi:hypothetical protein
MRSVLCVVAGWFALTSSGCIYSLDHGLIPVDSSADSSGDGSAMDGERDGARPDRDGDDDVTDAALDEAISPDTIPDDAISPDTISPDTQTPDTTPPLPPANDDCAGAIEIDLSTFTTKDYVIDTANAVNNYSHFCCGSSRPEVVFHLINGPASSLNFQCTEGLGGLRVLLGPDGGTCPIGNSGTSCTSPSCGGGSSSMGVGSDRYLYICREPSDGPATLTITKN